MERSELLSALKTVYSLLKQRKYPEALEVFQNLYYKYPDEPDVLYNFGIVLNALRDYIGGARVLEKLVSIDPEYENGKVALGYSYINMDKVEEGIAILEDARASDPDNLLILETLGAGYGKTNRFELALEIFSRAESLQPASRPTQYALAQTLCSLNRYQEASRHLKIIIDEGIDDKIDGEAKDLQREISSIAHSPDDLQKMTD